MKTSSSECTTDGRHKVELAKKFCVGSQKQLSIGTFPTKEAAANAEQSFAEVVRVWQDITGEDLYVSADRRNVRKVHGGSFRFTWE